MFSLSDCYRYILDDEGNPIKEPDSLKWETWFENNLEKCVVALGRLPNRIAISTIFMGVDYDHKTPLLFETMVFGGPHNGWSKKYATLKEAQAGHQEILRKESGRTI
jgi:hypothetical protein